MSVSVSVLVSVLVYQHVLHTVCISVLEDSAVAREYDVIRQSNRRQMGAKEIESELESPCGCDLVSRCP